MAQTNFTPILLYASSTPTNVPLAANLTNSATGSEIAINIADKNLFFKDSGGVVNTVPIRQSSTSSNGWLSATDWNTFNGKAPATSGTSILYGNGSGGFSNVTIGSGVSFVGGTLSATGSGGTVTSVTGTSPVVSSGGTTPAISLATAYGDTLNPYASKTANYVLAAPNGSAGVPTFRALVAADVPALAYVTSVSGTGSVNGITLTGTVTSSGSITLGGTLSGIGNSQLTNSTISGVALGGNLFNLTAGTGVSFSTGTTYNGSAAITINATGSGGTVTSVAALTLGTTGTDLSSTVANGTTTPVITLNVPTASATNRGALSAADWTTFNNKQPAGTYVTSVTGTAPVVSSGGTTPAISMAAATGSVNGYLTSTDWTTFNGKYSVGGALGTPSSATLTNATGLPIGGISATGTPSILTFLRGDGTWATPAGGGTVTSVAQSFTGGLISVSGSPIVTSGTLALTVAGTSGGIPYFSSASTWASSAALTQYGIVYGGGAGAAPVSTAAGTANQVLVSNGGASAPTFNTQLVSANMPVGSVIQVVNANLVGIASTSSSTFADTGLTATITPKFSTSKILITVSLSGCARDTNNTALQLRLLRGASQIVYMEDYAAGTGSVFSITVGGCGTSMLDSPATTSATTYKVQFASRSNNAGAYINNYGGTNQVASYITLMEIAQ
jgi:hypothetical protein